MFKHLLSFYKRFFHLDIVVVTKARVFGEITRQNQRWPNILFSKFGFILETDFFFEFKRSYTYDF